MLAVMNVREIRGHLKADPGRHITPRPESVGAGDGCDQRRRDQRADAGHDQQALSQSPNSGMVNRMRDSV